MENTDQIAQIKISLEGPRPPIWRRILVPMSMTLGDLHDILLTVMGWNGYHMHNFLINGTNYHDKWEDDSNWADESQVKLGNVIKRTGQQFLYEYDFGDSWRHTLVVEAIVLPKEDQEYPVCIKGKRACPPEDVGGLWGYEEFVEGMADKNHPRHKEFSEWFGSKFDPEEFDLDKINRELRDPSSAEEASLGDLSDAYALELFGIIMQAGANVELPEISPEILEAVKELPHLRDMHTLLNYLKNNKVVGTKTTGNFPLKACAALSSQFSKPFAMEYQTGGKTKKVRSEDDLPDLHFIHGLAVHCGLITGGKNTRWELTPTADYFLSLDPIKQMTTLFFGWFIFANWQLGEDEISSEDMFDLGLKLMTLELLHSLEVGKPVDFDDLISELFEIDAEMADDEDFDDDEDLDDEDFEDEDLDDEDFDEEDFISDEEMDAMLDAMPEESLTWLANPWLMPKIQIGNSAMKPMEKFGIVRLHKQEIELFGGSLAMIDKVETTPFGSILLDILSTTMEHVEVMLSAANGPDD